MSKIRSHFSAAEMATDSRAISGPDMAPYLALFGTYGSHTLRLISRVLGLREPG